MRPPGLRGSLAPGHRIAGYVIEQQVGTGGMSVVYRARDDALGRLVALKVLAPALAADEEFRIRFTRESRAVAAVDGRTDQYSLACVAFTLLAGVVPYRHGDVLSRLYAHVNSPVPAVTSIRAGLPAAVNGVLAKGMAKNPAERYESCAAFAWALRGALGSGTGASPAWTPPSVPVARRRPPRPGPRLIIGGVAAVLVLAAGVIAGAVLSSQRGTAGGSPRTGTALLAGSVTAPGGHSMKAAFLSQDGKYIVGASTTSAMYVWSTETFSLVGTASVAGKVADPISLSPDGRTLYALDATSRKLYDFNIETGQATHVYPLPAAAGLDYAYDSSVLDAISADGAVSEISLATGQVTVTVPNPGSAKVVSARSDGAGNYLLIGDANGTAYLVDTQSKQVSGTFRYPAAGGTEPEISLDGNTVYVPGGSTAPAKIWDTASRSYRTPADPLWPAPDNGVFIATDSKFDMTSPTSVSETVDIWNIATRAHVITLTVPGGVNEEVLSIGPGASELLSTSGLNLTKGTFAKMDVWSVPG